MEEGVKPFKTRLASTPGPFYRFHRLVNVTTEGLGDGIPVNWLLKIINATYLTVKVNPEGSEDQFRQDCIYSYWMLNSLKSSVMDGLFWARLTVRHWISLATRKTPFPNMVIYPVSH